MIHLPTPKQVHEFADKYDEMYLALVQCEAVNKILKAENEELKEKIKRLENPN